MGNVEYNLGLFIGNNLWQSIAVLMVVLGILKLVKSSTAEERSWVWTAALIAVAPNCGALTVDKLPKKLPIGVLTADTMTTSLFIILEFEVNSPRN